MQSLDMPMQQKLENKNNNNNNNNEVHDATCWERFLLCNK